MHLYLSGFLYSVVTAVYLALRVQDTTPVLLLKLSLLIDINLGLNSIPLLAHSDCTTNSMRDINKLLYIGRKS